jgi:hypothetical protein
MGRYYHGDIEGKFWFGVQSSDDGEYFGMREAEYSIQYYSDDLELAKEGVRECLNILGKYKIEIDKYFTECSSYTDEKLAKTLNISVDKLKEILVWYARLRLGQKIVDCIKEQGSCYYEAEL